MAKKKSSVFYNPFEDSSNSETEASNPLTLYKKSLANGSAEDTFATDVKGQAAPAPADKNKKPANGQNGVEKVLGGVGHFIKGAAKSVKDDAVTAWQDLGDVARGYRAEQDVKHHTEQLQARNKEWSDKFGNATDEQWNDPKFQAEAKKFTADTKKTRW